MEPTFNELRDAEFLHSIYKHIIPKYGEVHDVIVSMLDFDSEASLRVLDLGCGTGALSRRVLSIFPKAEVVGIDDSKEMLEWCRKDLKNYGERFSIHHRDFNNLDWNKGLGDFDAVVSAFTFHLLFYETQQRVIRDSFALSNNNARFVMCDFFDTLDPWISKVFHDMEVELIQTALKQKKISKLQLDRLESLENFRSQQRYVCTLNMPLDWLKDAGFDSVDVPWRFFNFSVVSGKKF